MEEIIKKIREGGELMVRDKICTVKTAAKDKHRQVLKAVVEGLLQNMGPPLTQSSMGYSASWEKIATA